MKQSKSNIVKEWKSSDIKIKKDSKGLLWVVLGKEKAKLPKDLKVKSITLSQAEGFLGLENEEDVNKGGRPTKFKEDYSEQVFKLCLLGLTDEEMATFFGVCESTFHKWKLDFPEFSESIRAGKDIADVEVVQSAFKSTQDRLIPTQQAFKVKTVRYNDKGQREEKEDVIVVDVMQGVPANAQIQQFWLRNRRPKEWNKPTNVDHTSQGEKIETTPARILTKKEAQELRNSLDNDY